MKQKFTGFCPSEKLKQKMFALYADNNKNAFEGNNKVIKSILANEKELPQSLANDM